MLHPGGILCHTPGRVFPPQGGHAKRAPRGGVCNTGECNTLCNTPPSRQAFSLRLLMRPLAAQGGETDNGIGREKKGGCRGFPRPTNITRKSYVLWVILNQLIRYSNHIKE